MIESSEEPLDWMTQTQPFSKRFEDRFFAEEDGLAESRYVFLGQNFLPLAWQQPTRSSFVVGELGFGTALNFLATWQLWNQTKPANTWLHFVSCEKFPLSKTQIRTTMKAWPELDHLLNAFLDHYEILYQGPHRFTFPNDRVRLDLHIGEALDSWKKFSGRVDAWYLDGFSPSKNPEMWSASLFTRLAECSVPRATFATYASAGFVRRNLEGAGFHVEKFKGFGRKREMLKGFMKSESAQFQATTVQDSVSIVGAGLAGCQMSYALAHRVPDLHLYESQPDICQLASGNPQAVLLPILSREMCWNRLFSIQGLQILRDQSRSIASEAGAFRFCGALQLAITSEEEVRLKACLVAMNERPELVRWVDAIEASEIAGLRVDYPGVFFPAAGFIRPQSYCRSLVNQFKDRIQLHLDKPVEALSRLNSSKPLVICNSLAAQTFPEAEWMPLNAVRGQLIELDQAAPIDTIICANSYLTPSPSLLGSTFDRDDLSLEIRESENQRLIAEWNSLSIDHKVSLDQIRSTRVALRASAPGQLPIVGALCSQNGQEIANHFVSLALASRGALFAPIAAELVASLINDEPSPIPSDLLHMLSPLRHSTRLRGRVT